MAILGVLHEAGSPLGGARIAEELHAQGIELSQRTVRLYLGQTDEMGLTENLHRRGRKLTEQGREELASGLAIDKVGFVAARVEALSYRMRFDLRRCRGKVILNVSCFAVEHVERACAEIARAFEADLGMGRYLAVGGPGAEIGGFHVPDGQVAVGTVCSVSLNGVLLRSGISTASLFGGLLEMRQGEPFRFTQIIHYAGSTIDPLEIFIKGHMTTVREAARTGQGSIGASFREIPAEAVQDARRVTSRMRRVGLGGAMVIGRSGQPLLDVPVPQGRAGMIVAGGLNPLAAVEEAGIPTRNIALHTLYDFERLVPYTALEREATRLASEGK